MTTPKHQRLPFSDAFVSDLPKKAMDELGRASESIMDDLAWREWVDTTIPTINEDPEVFHYVQVDDRARRRIVVRGRSLSVYESAAEIIRAHQEGRLQEHYLEMFQAMYTRWADRHDLPPPPPIPDPRS